MRNLFVVAIALLLFTACGGSSAGPSTVDQSMIDVITNYTQVVYENDQENFTKYMCQQDADTNIKQAESLGIGSQKMNTGGKYDLSEVKWSIDQKNAAGDVINLKVDSGELKVTLAGGTVTNTMPIPGSAGGVRLKNENGWKVCYSASLK